MKNWKECKNILCIRADNMGDVLMSAPAINALKKFTAGRITLLTSPGGAEAAKLLPSVDEVIIFEAPWVKTGPMCGDPDSIQALVNRLVISGFDCCVIFTVYSQNPLPAVMLAYMAKIPLRLAYCRENPYQLLTEWVVEKEPYHFIRHQVERDLDLVGSIGAFAAEKKIQIASLNSCSITAAEKMSVAGVSLGLPYLVLHPGVSEPKREYPPEKWIEVGKLLKERLHIQLLITGSSSERRRCARVAEHIGSDVFNLAGLLSTEEFAAVLGKATVVISVNTSAVHLSAAAGIPVVVLYAESNPQHTPWMVPNRVLYYSVPDIYKSKNDIIAHVDQLHYRNKKSYPDAQQIVEAVESLLN